MQRICLFDTWLSSVLVGRSVATVAELCFAIQWAIVLRELAKITHSDTAKNISKLVVPLIASAECCSWYAVVSTNFLGNVLENALWTIAGLHELATHWVVTHNIARWRNEIPWMSLYFNVAVWTSVSLGGFGLVRHLVPRYRIGRPLVKATRRPVPVAIRSS